MDYDKMCYGKTVQKGMKLRATGYKLQVAALYITERYPVITLSLYHLITFSSYPYKNE